MFTLVQVPLTVLDKWVAIILKMLSRATNTVYPYRERNERERKMRKEVGLQEENLSEHLSTQRV